MSAATLQQRSEAGNQLSQVKTDTLAGFCLEAIVRHNKPNTVSEKRGGEWHRVASEEFAQRVRHIALGLADLGIQPGDRVGLISENRPEWSIVDLAILSAGAVVVPLYTTQAPDQIRFILEDSGARALMISGGRILKHAHEGFAGIDRLTDVIVFDSKSAEGVNRAVTLEKIEGRGAKMDRDDATAFDRLLGRGRPGRSRDDHLHLRNNGRTEGRDANE
jgi:long-chain acyl-CoA synthetase